jgi:hypothetical protein
MSDAETPTGTLPGSSTTPTVSLPVTICTATKPDGTPCRSVALSGSTRCFWHSDRERVAAAGRKGAANSHRVGPITCGTVRLADTDEVRRLLAATVNGLRKGTLDPTRANALVRALNASMQILQVSDLARRLAALEVGKDAK